MDTWRGKGFLVHSTFTEADRKRGQEVRMKQRGQRVRAQQKASREEQAMLEKGRAVRQKQAAERAEKKMKERGRRIRLNQKAQREWEAKTQRAVAQERMGRASAGYGRSGGRSSNTSSSAPVTTPTRITASQAYTEIMNKISQANYIGNCAVLGLAGGSDFDKACDDLQNFICNQCDEYMANYGLTYDDAVTVAQKLINDCGEAIGLMIANMRAEQQRQITSPPTYDPATGMWW